MFGDDFGVVKDVFGVKVLEKYGVMCVVFSVCVFKLNY